MRRGCDYRPNILSAVASFVLCLLAATALAAESEMTPRYAALRADEVNLRTGPGERYPIAWVYHRKGLPVEVTAEYDVWRRGSAMRENNEGWVHNTSISGTRNVIVRGRGAHLARRARAHRARVARAEARGDRAPRRMPRRLVPRRGRGHQGLAQARRDLGRPIPTKPCSRRGRKRLSKILGQDGAYRSRG